MEERIKAIVTQVLKNAEAKGVRIRPDVDFIVRFDSNKNTLLDAINEIGGNSGSFRTIDVLTNEDVLKLGGIKEYDPDFAEYVNNLENSGCVFEATKNLGETEGALIFFYHQRG